MELTEAETGGYAGCGFGRPGEPEFWIGKDSGPGSQPVPGSLHLAFRADDRAAVDAFHAAALAAGGRDNGPPGLRPQYGPDYYAAFVFDPDGHNLEAVCHRPG
jgi:catechol 2,3-dioxygenase-like lactoylglutathione lyase family enzyme